MSREPSELSGLDPEHSLGITMGYPVAISL